jgi:putative ABC transport system substrate-binding protein
MRRRDLLALAGAVIVAKVERAVAQVKAAPVVGFLSVRAQTDELNLVIASVREGLNQTGYVEPDDVRIEYRWAEGRYEKLTELAADLVRIPSAVIICSGGTQSALAAKATTGTTPVIFISGADPVAAGLVESLNRPGGNLTGIMVLSRVLLDKQFELLDALLPKSAAVAMLVNPISTFIATSDLGAAGAAAERLGRRLVVANVTRDSDLEPAIDEIARKGAAGLVVSPDPVMSSLIPRLTALARSRGVAAVSEYREFAQNGGLFAYGTSIAETYRQAGIYAGKILGGTRPADLPVVQMSKLELVLNLKTANALGLTIPTSLLARADEVIE